MTGNFYPCELHCHTVHSDGDFTLKELISTAKERYLSGICLTDHNTMSGHKEAEDDTLVILKGIEWTTFYGHMLCLGSERFIDWRDANPDNIDSKTDAVKAVGGLCGAAHPFQWGTPICTGGHWDFNVKKWENFSYLEVFSEGEPYLNVKNQLAIELWHSLLDKGYKIAPTMGRDWHRTRGNRNIAACTYLYCEGNLTAEKMKSAIERGKTIVTTGTEFTFDINGKFTVGDEISCGEHQINIDISLSRYKKLVFEQVYNFKEIRLISNGGVIVKVIDAKEKDFIFNFISGNWYSLELWGDIGDNKDTLLALTAAFYVR